MRYYLTRSTLFIRGSFRAASTGILGGIRPVSSLINHTVPPDGRNDPEKEIERVAAAEGIGCDLFALLTTVPVHQGCILQYDFITVFITAGIRREPPATAGTITITVTSSEGMEDAALLETIMVATEAKAEALLGLDLPATGTPTDAVIAASEGVAVHRHAGRITPAGQRVREAVLYGIPEALRRHDAGVQSGRPAFFIYSRFQGGHWAEWKPGKECPYYPCHFEGQACDFCYCPFYPCKDERLGQWVESSGGGRVWNCAGCTLLHEPAVAAYFGQFPNASREELMQFAEQQKQKT
ncbi:MAG TPA: adenosylcobinamide amidohydrolase [Methanoregula sp.]|nr:adenosylcobinamide amidohydrolase [Methanoregula sp.]